MIPFPPGPFTPDVLLLAAGLVFAGYLLFGITGFGASFVTVPVLSHSLPLPYLLSLSTLLDFWAALALSWRHRRDVAYAELARMLPFTLAGSAAGLALLVSLPRAVIMGALGLFVVGNSLWSLRAQRSTAPVHRAWAVPAGLVGGVFGSLFGVGGPPQVIYITRRLGDSPRLRPTIAMTVALSVGVRVIVFSVAGLMLRTDVLVAFLCLFPVALAGLVIGNRVHLALSPAQVLRVVNAFLMIVGISLLARAVA